MKNYQIYKSFPTPVFHYNLENYEEFNNSLENYILNIKNQNKDGIIKSNQGGWHSPNFDLKNDKSAKKFVSVFDKYVEKTIKEIGWNYDSKRAIIEAMWSIINKKGSFNIQHNHPNAFLSSAYYVKFPKNSGNIKFFDPREQKNIRYPKIKKFTEMSAPIVEVGPKEGDLLIFPAYLYHSVSQNLSDEDRIIVSFNVDIKYK
jgi:uncharacterized protein (TIGR02466 family)|tara:strand:+ start:116 stop:721 length:606 start_codon:yes stop_codon:yes gene_type:complete